LIVRPIARERVRVLGRVLVRELCLVRWRSLVSTCVVVGVIVRKLSGDRERGAAHFRRWPSAAVDGGWTRPGMVRCIHNRGRAVNLACLHIVLVTGSSFVPIPNDADNEQQQEDQNHQAPNRDSDPRRVGYAASTHFLARTVLCTQIPAKPSRRSSRDRPRRDDPNDRGSGNEESIHYKGSLGVRRTVAFGN